MSESIAGYCPMGCGQTLFLADGGHVTCSYVTCPNPTGVDDLLHNREVEHVVNFTGSGFTIKHPLRERLSDELLNCELHETLSSYDGPPVKPGRYRVFVNTTTTNASRFTYILLESTT